MENENLYKKLRALTKKEDIEKKKTGNGIALDYISWATAWDAVEEAGYKIKRTVYETPEGRIYWDDGRTAWVKVGISVNGEDEQIEYLPIMGFKNEALPIDRISAMEVNKAIQRCTVKAIARACGYGIQVYIGEDLPDEEDGNRISKPASYQPRQHAETTITQSQMSAIASLIHLTKSNAAELQAEFGEIRKMTNSQAEGLIGYLKSKLDGGNENE